MGCPDDVRQLEQRVVGRQRLGVDDVEPGASEPARSKRLDEGGLVDDRAARDVHQEGARPHRREAARIEEPARLVGQGAGDDDDVRLGEQLFERPVAHALVRDRRSLSDEHAHSPRREQSHELTPDPSVADHAERPTLESDPRRLEASLGPPVRGVEGAVALTKPMGEGEHERDRGGRHRVGDAPRRDRDRDATGRAGGTSTKSRPTP